MRSERFFLPQLIAGLLPTLGIGRIAVSLTGVFITGALILFWRKKRTAKEARGTTGQAQEAAEPQIARPVEREPDAIYQGNRIVARVPDPEVDLQAKEIRFAEIYNSDSLLLTDECEFQKYRIMIQRIAYASKAEKTAEHKGRVLRGVIAEILGYREP